MPYVPSTKTDGTSDDRIKIDEKVDALAEDIVKKLSNNFDILDKYKAVFQHIAQGLIARQYYDEGTLFPVRIPSAQQLVDTIWDVAKKYNYQGAFLGELNYAITRLIQRVPKLRVSKFDLPQKEELRYWLYAVTVEALTWASVEFRGSSIGVSGVFEDIKDEYKRRVNVSYEAAQIVKSGDCYDAPYYTRLVEVRDEHDNLIGHQEIMLKRSEDTLNKDVLNKVFVLHSKKAKVVN